MNSPNALPRPDAEPNRIDEIRDDFYYTLLEGGFIVASEGYMPENGKHPKEVRAKTRLYKAIMEEAFPVGDDDRGIARLPLRKHGNDMQHEWFVRGKELKQWISESFRPRIPEFGYFKKEKHPENEVSL